MFADGVVLDAVKSDDGIGVKWFRRWWAMQAPLIDRQQSRSPNRVSSAAPGLIHQPLAPASGVEARPESEDPAVGTAARSIKYGCSPGRSSGRPIRLQIRRPLGEWSSSSTSASMAAASRGPHSSPPCNRRATTNCRAGRTPVQATDQHATTAMGASPADGPPPGPPGRPAISPHRRPARGRLPLSSWTVS